MGIYRQPTVFLKRLRYADLLQCVKRAGDFNVGNTIWVDVQGRRKGELPRDNSIMLRLKDELDRLSDTLGVSKLSDFYNYSELKAYYADFMEQSDPSSNAAEVVDSASSTGDWFDPAPALTAVCTIYDHLKKHPDNLPLPSDPRRHNWPATLIEELKECQSTLTAAVSQGRRFRFLIVP